MELRIQKIHPDAKLPAFAHTTDAGLDLCTLEEVTILPGERRTIRTGLALAIPEGYVGLLWDKGGISHKRGLKSFGGVIDTEYRGELFVGLANIGTESQTFNAGDKIVQILIQKVEHPTIVEVESLDETVRGSGAFGSTGI
jgi:dUTP pyrophosphatase